jgi:hypothetical protein
MPMATGAADVQCPTLMEYFYIHSHPATTRLTEELVLLKTKLQFKRMQIHTCFGGSLAEYIFGTYGRVSAPMSTRLTFRMASDF